MPEKLIEWSETKKWVMFLLRGIIGTMFVLVVIQTAIMFVDVKIMKSNRFTKEQGADHAGRLIKLETTYPLISEDISEIKADMKLLLRK